MQLRSLFAGAVLAVVAFAAAPSFAATVQSVNLTGSVASATVDTALSIGDGAIIAGSTTKPGILSQVVFFETADAGKAWVSATTNTLAPFFDLKGLVYTVFDKATNTALGSAAASSVLSFAAAAGGEYFVVFAGNATGKLGGNYAGNIALTPIPGAVLLLGPALAGLGYVGYRRRQSASAA